MMKKLLMAVVLGSLSVASGEAGVQYSATVTVKHELGAAADSTTVNVWIGGGKAKAEYVETTVNGVEPGDWLLTLDGGATALLVNPREKTTSSCEVDPVFGVLRGAQPNLVLPYETTNSNLEVKLLEENEGESVAGQATVHYKFRISYTTTGQRRNGVVISNRVIEHEIWTIPDLDFGRPRSWPVRVPLGMTKKGLGDAVEKAFSVVRGAPVKALTVQTVTNDDGSERVTEGRFEVTKIEVVDVPDEAFAVPAGFQKGEFRSSMFSDPTLRAKRTMNSPAEGFPARRERPNHESPSVPPTR